MDPRSPTPARITRRLPRASGDGPSKARPIRLSIWAPPRERGWTRAARPLELTPHGSPARAGMDLGGDRWAATLLRLPRASGDGPSRFVLRTACLRAPPRERGWTHGAERPFRPAPGSPARARMDPSSALEHGIAVRLPRASGDGPWQHRHGSDAVVAPPRERGWTRRCHLMPPMGAGSPARAGMDPAGVSSSGFITRLPRASGDGPEQRRTLGAVPRRVCGAEASAAVSTDDIFAPIAPTRISTPARDIDPGARIRRVRGCSSMAERQLPKLHTRVRFPSPAPEAAIGFVVN